MIKKDLLGPIAIIICLGVVLVGPARTQPSAVTQLQPVSENGLVTVASLHPVADTLARFETAVRAKGWIVFTRLDHAAMAEAAGLTLRSRTVVVFGNPKDGTPAMRINPTLALDLPLKALVWEDDNGKVWLTYNAATFIGQSIYGRHGPVLGDEPTQGLMKLLADVARDATQ